jgi:mannose/fructose/sorbose-specific phosphotransferase system IIA component
MKSRSTKSLNKEPQSPHTIIVGHGSFPQGLLTAAEKILGKQEDILAVSNHGMGVQELSEKLRKGLTGTNNRVYVFIDLIGGSCFTSCRMLTPDHPDLVLISGVNLPMLVTYLTYRNRLSNKDLLAKILEAGCRGIGKI